LQMVASGHWLFSQPHKPATLKLFRVLLLTILVHGNYSDAT
jgi:hypothetical protein